MVLQGDLSHLRIFLQIPGAKCFFEQPALKIIQISLWVFPAYFNRDEGAPEQIIKVERLSLPPPEERRRSAEMLDVMEVIFQQIIC